MVQAAQHAGGFLLAAHRRVEIDHKLLGIVALVAQNTVWKIKNTPIGSPLNIPSASASAVGLKNPLIPMIPWKSVPCMIANPNTKNYLLNAKSHTANRFWDQNDMSEYAPL